MNDPNQHPVSRGDEFPRLSEESFIKPNQLQALFLKSNKTYFGNMWVVEEGYALNNVHYLQNVLKEDGSILYENGKPKQILIKLGNEIHGPEDAMFIPRHSIDFWENLRDDSSVSQAIRESQDQT